MKIKLPTLWPYFTVAIFLTPGIFHAQVGINTTTPNGILEINSSVHGVVLPRLALTATNVMAPAINPRGGTIPAGTTIYNTNSTANGINDVYPGIYVWDGNRWINQFTKKDIQIYKQDPLGYRSKSSDDYIDLGNLGSRNFTPVYSGWYKIEVSMNYGAGSPRTVSGDFRALTQEGNFRFRFAGDNHVIPARAYSTRSGSNSGQDYFLIWEQHSFILYRNLVAGQNYNFRLQFDQLPAPNFDGNGDTTGELAGGAGYVGYDIPCSVEFIYIDE
ncbi:hypothetical protein QRD02_10135 [Aequorivita sp. SDUM287046]|uniref:DUF4249 domain-containing protein n=1 Tax=Aequorivita aurantiaca TaxID=3053356 RepID=A0ABT8DHF6_9FLAO|nr:hypothetical protein [Aequorivita aurantiaca]MDN3724743.1 hypothetical protein [Aequorivita aurantiaca]